MTDFTPEAEHSRQHHFDAEHYLTAARIAYPGCRTQINAIGHAIVLVDCAWNTFNEDTIDDYHYRALREALNKEYKISIGWFDAEGKWESHHRRLLIDSIFDNDITRLMMKNVVALVEAGVVE